MIESTRKDIEEVSFELLKQSKAFDIFPTPVDRIVEHSELIINNNVDLSHIDKTFFESLKEKTGEGIKILQEGLLNIRGLFDRSESTIYISQTRHLGRKNFVKLHETGHGVLPWQSAVIGAFDNATTLNPDFEDQFEEEANYFASITLFQHNRFDREMRKFDFGLPGIVALAKKFGASVHASFRNYIFKTSKRCALLVLDPIQNRNFYKPICSTRNLFYSKSFFLEFGKIDFPEQFGYTWDFIPRYLSKSPFITDGEITLTLKSGEIMEANYHLFKNGYNAFVLIFPKGEKMKKARNKVILK
ncbi:ImmA/IrrE family metallo-endopeptidase [Flagellimonas amoyensis]|uniref:ImmA/IrrE family metallo-endopeptidase n=1 Tax=Flagellimonas amoyensis TaxID=2169401 RepID=UPI000D3CE665|nr:ImmA/IrrE family metallo-endopeptidase [Allomuricauda amoyensis]